jgi:hypothetical protein
MMGTLINNALPLRLVVARDERLARTFAQLISQTYLLPAANRNSVGRQAKPDLRILIDSFTYYSAVRTSFLAGATEGPPKGPNGHPDA